MIKIAITSNTREAFNETIKNNDENKNYENNIDQNNVDISFETAIITLEKMLANEDCENHLKFCKIILETPKTQQNQNNLLKITKILVKTGDDFYEQEGYDEALPYYQFVLSSAFALPIDNNKQKEIEQKILNCLITLGDKFKNSIGCEKAINYYQQIIEIIGAKNNCKINDNNDKLKIEILIKMAGVFTKIGKYHEAILKYQEILQIQPYNIEILEKLGNLFLEIIPLDNNELVYITLMQNKENALRCFYEILNILQKYSETASSSYLNQQTQIEKIRVSNKILDTLNDLYEEYYGKKNYSEHLNKSNEKSIYKNLFDYTKNNKFLQYIYCTFGNNLLGTPNIKQKFIKFISHIKTKLKIIADDFYKQGILEELQIESYDIKKIIVCYYKAHQYYTNALALLEWAEKIKQNGNAKNNAQNIYSKDKEILKNTTNETKNKLNKLKNPMKLYALLHKISYENKNNNNTSNNNDRKTNNNNQKIQTTTTTIISNAPINSTSNYKTISTNKTQKNLISYNNTKNQSSFTFEDYQDYKKQLNTTYQDFIIKK